MPEFTGFDYLIFAALGGFIIWSLVGIISSRGRIKLRGKLFGRIASISIFAGLMAFAIYRQRDALVSVWVIFAFLIVAFVLFLFMKVGLGDNGIFFNGKFVAYDKIKSYSVERETETNFSLRLDVGRKEYVMEFKQDERELVMGYMAKGKVPDVKVLRGKKG